jgi:RND superfamily putative drug exporter
MTCVAGLYAATRLPGLLTTSLAVPGSSSQKADAILARHFGENTEGTFSVVSLVPRPAREPAPTKALEAAFERHLRAAAGLSVPDAVVSAPQAGNGVLYANVATPFGLERASSYTARLREALSKVGLHDAYVTGAPALQADIGGVLNGDLRRGELIAALSALVFLFLALGPTPAVVLPFVMALCSSSATLGVVYLLAHQFSMVLYVPNLVDLIGLGLAVDYCLLVVHRFSQEMSLGRSLEDALAATMATAGRTVALSGAAVAVGLSVLLIVPVPFVRSLGAAGLLVPLSSVVAALTLVPALLYWLGLYGLGRQGRGQPRLGRHWAGVSAGRPGRGSRFRRRCPSGANEPTGVEPVPTRPRRRPAWARLASLVIARPVPVAAACLAVLVPAAYAATSLQLTPASMRALPKAMPSAKGLFTLSQRAGPGVLTPLEVVVDARRPGGALSPAMDAATMRLAQELLAQHDVFVVAIGTKGQYVDPSRRYRRTVVVLRDDFGAERAQALARLLTRHLVAGARFPKGSLVYVGGAPAQGEEFLAHVYGAFEWLAALVAVLAYLLLARAFRSLLLPLLAIVLDGASMLAAFGLLVVVFRWGVGAEVLGLYRVGQLEGWVPLFFFASLFGLSMDYEMFFVTRMREAYDAGMDNPAAIAEGLGRTGNVVSVAAIIMIGAVSGLAAGHVAGLQELGVGLALGVAMDATLVRGLLMPSLMVLIGPANWWVPTPLARALGCRRPTSPPRWPSGSQVAGTQEPEQARRSRK